MTSKSAKRGGGAPLKFKNTTIKVCTSYPFNDDALKALKSGAITDDSWKIIRNTIRRANQRIDRLYAVAGPSGDLISPALMSTTDNFLGSKPKRFSTVRPRKGNQASLANALNQYQQAVNFLQKPTSTVSGAKDYTRNFIAQLKTQFEQLDIDFDEKLFPQYKKIAMNDVEENYVSSTFLYAEQRDAMINAFRTAIKRDAQVIIDDSKRITDELHKQHEIAHKEALDALKNASIDDLFSGGEKLR